MTVLYVRGMTVLYVRGMTVLYVRGMLYVNTLKSSSQGCFDHCVFIVILLLRKFYI
jgi:hypothetical protein